MKLNSNTKSRLAVEIQKKIDHLKEMGMKAEQKWKKTKRHFVGDCVCLP